MKLQLRPGLVHERSSEKSSLMRVSALASRFQDDAMPAQKVPKCFKSHLFSVQKCLKTAAYQNGFFRRDMLSGITR